MKYPILFAMLTALFWGLYGPTLAVSRSHLNQSPFKPYVMIGIAYLIWGVFGGIGGMVYKGDTFSFSGPGMAWAFVGGSLGAFGAFTLTLAMFSGGGPIVNVVMSIVFGGAVTVAALCHVVQHRHHTQVHPMLWVGIAGILVSAIVVAYYTPHVKPAAKSAAATPAPVPQHTST